MNPHIILLCICEFHEYRRREVPPVVVTVSEVTLTRVHWNLTAVRRRRSPW